MLTILELGEIMDKMVQFVTILGVFGIPSIFSMTMWCVKKCKDFSEQMKTLMSAQKAQMRSQMLKDYEYYQERGYITDIEMQEWQNQYNAYHKLVGANGVLEARYDTLKQMPTHK